MSNKPAASTSTRRPEPFVAIVGATIGLAILGDSLMYGILPLEGGNLGFSSIQIGVLLSANRIVRLISNTWASGIFERFGARRPFAVATVLALTTTLLYGAGFGFAVFLFARAGWGVAWSGLRQGAYQAIWSGEDRIKGRLTGVLWGIVRLGSAVSVVVGGFVRDHAGYQAAVATIALITALALPVALFMRWPEKATGASVDARSVRSRSLHGWRMALTTPAGRWISIVALSFHVFEAVLISTASIFLMNRLGSDQPLARLGIGVGTVTGLILAIRWTSDLVFGPLIGALSDRLGQSRTMLLLVGVLMVGLMGAIATSGLLAVLFLSIAFVAAAGLQVTISAASTGIATRSERPHLLIGAFTTAMDAGQALGPLIAFSIGSTLDIGVLYVVGLGVVALAVLRYWWVAR